MDWLLELAQSSADEIPPEWKSRDTIQRELGIRRTQACEIVKMGVESGQLVMKKFRKPNLAGSTNLVPHYKDVRPCKKK